MCALGLLLAPHRARAVEPVVAELEYRVAAELSGCPDEASFRLAVSKRLGRDPFVAGALRKIEVSLTRNGATMTARVRVQDMGEARGERRIDTSTSCEDLASGAALAVSMAIDPIAALGPPPSGEPEGSEPEQKPEPEPAEAAEPEAPPPSPAPPALSLRLPERGLAGERGRLVAWAGVRAWSGVVPALSVGPSLGLDYVRGAWSLGLDAFVVPAQTEPVFGSERHVSVSLYGAELAPCARLTELQACALFESGVLVARGEGVAQPQTGRSFFAAAGLRIGYSLALGRFSLTPSTQLAVRMQRSVLSLNDAPVWTTPRALGALGLDLGYEL